MNKQPNVVLHIYPDQAVHWFLVDASGRVLQQQRYAGFSELPKTTVETSCVVLVPGKHVYSEVVALPHTRLSQAKKIVSFRLEDKLMGDVSQRHQVVQRVDHDHYAVMAMDNVLWEGYVSQVLQCGYVPWVVRPDYLGLPYDESNWTIKVSRSWAWVRLGRYTGFSVPLSQITLALQLKLKTEPADKPIASQLQWVEDDFSQASLDLPLTSVTRIPPNLFDPHLFDEKSLMDLSQGVYRRSASTQKKSKRAWRYAFYAFLLWVLVWLLSSVGQLIFYHHEKAHLDQDIQGVLQSLFKGETPFEDPQAQLKRALQKGGLQKPADVFMTLLYAAGKSLQQTPGVALESVSYQASQLAITVRAPTLSELEALTRSLEAGSLRVKKNTVKTRAHDVVGQLIVEEAR